MKSILTLRAFLLAAFCNLGSIAVAEQTVIIALPYSDSIAESFAENLSRKINEKSDGELDAHVYAGGSLGKSRDLYDKLGLGTVHIALLPARHPFYTTGLSSPFAFSSVDAAVPYFQSFVGIDTDRAVTFAVIPTDVAVLISQEPVDSNDLSSLEILTRRPDLANAYGIYQPYRTTLTERLISGVPTGAAVEGFLFRLGEPQGDRAVSRLDHRFLTSVVLADRDYYNTFSDEHRRILHDAVMEASANAIFEFRNRIPEEVERLRGLGWDIYDQTPVEYFHPDRTSGGDDCLADEYKKKYEKDCRCDKGSKKDEC